jgi:predicted TIM-barrel fold metal-dependent hydrolase
MPTPAAAEPILAPDLPIVDPHHHLWDRRALVSQMPPPQHGFDHVLRRAPRYLADELLADMNAGHDVTATVFLECGSMYRAEGPQELKSLGETEFVNGIAAMGASGTYGDKRPCAAIIGNVSLALGARAGDILDQHVAVSGGRFRGIRNSASYDPDPNVLGARWRAMQPGVYLGAAFREGFAQLAPRNLSFDAWMLEPQLPDLIDLARAFESTRVVLDHVGTPLGIASYSGKRQERFPIWRENIRALAKSPNVFVKLGGLAMPFCGFASFMSDRPAPSEQLAAEWRPYIETCIEAFGPERCMFESNFPVDALSCDYATLWNAFKRIAANYSAAEKTALFSGTAANFYRLAL